MKTGKNKAGLNEPLHIKISFLRRSLNIPQKEMSSILEIDQSLLSKYERGKRELPSEHLEKFSRLFGLEVFQFLDCDGLDILVNFVVYKKKLHKTTQDNKIKCFNFNVLCYQKYNACLI